MSFAFMPFYTGDYLRDTRHLTPLKHGVYLLLLMHSWDQQGPLPLDEQECAGIANCRSADEVDALRYILDRFWVRMDDGWYNRRMQAELERANAISLKRKSAGAKGYQAKAKHLLSKRKASASTLTPTTTPTLTPTTKTTSTPSASRKTPCPQEFEITVGMQSWAEQEGIPANRLMPETEKFLDHARANDRKCLNWKAAWRNWLRKAKEMQPVR